jgi:Sec-independent protein translocase protein TatA
VTRTLEVALLVVVLIVAVLIFGTALHDAIGSLP